MVAAREVLAALLAMPRGASTGAAAAATPVGFESVVVDAATAGDVKLVGDIDRDGFPDLVVGGSPGEDLSWYRYPTWRRTVIATPATEFTTDGDLGAVDGDGDPDVTVPDGRDGDNLLWFENPLPNGDPAAARARRRCRAVGQGG